MRSICEEVPRIFAIIGYTIKIIQILVPIIIVVIGSIDLVKAVIAKNDNEIKKNLIKVVKRIGLGVFIFFIPPIIYFLISLTSIDRSNSKLCFDCINDPKKCMENALVKESKTTVECTDSKFSTRDACCKATYNNEMIYDYKIGCIKPDILEKE